MSREPDRGMAATLAARLVGHGLDLWDEGGLEAMVQHDARDPRRRDLCRADGSDLLLPLAGRVGPSTADNQ